MYLQRVRPQVELGVPARVGHDVGPQHLLHILLDFAPEGRHLWFWCLFLCICERGVVGVTHIYNKNDRPTYQGRYAPALTILRPSAATRRLQEAHEGGVVLDDGREVRVGRAEEGEERGLLFLVLLCCCVVTFLVFCGESGAYI